MGIALDLSGIRSKLESKIIGKDIFLFDEIDSTNRKANELGTEGAAEGTLVLAESQTKGKGRLGRNWFSPRGVNLYLSIILRPAIQLVEAQLITVVAAVSICETIKKVTSVKPGIKWPNDILVHERKIAGILTELSSSQDSINYIVVGIGINLNMEVSSAPEEIRNSAGSLKWVLKGDLDRTEFLVALISIFEYFYLIFKSGKKKKIMDIYADYSVTLGKRIRVDFQDRSAEGLACGFDSNGVLLLRRDDGTVETLVAGDINHIKQKHK